MSTVRMYELIKKTNLSDEQAESLVAELEAFMNERFNDRKEHLATKQDVEASKTDLTEKIGLVKVDLAMMETRLIKWTIGTGAGVAGLVVTLIKLL